MKEPIWILDAVAIAINKMQIAKYGGSDGIRDEGMLISALNRPKQAWHYEQPSIFKLASNYTYGIIKNHPFVDGNKRTAYNICELFLKLNGYIVNTTQEEKYRVVILLAQDLLTEDEFALWIENNTKKLDK